MVVISRVTTLDKKVNNEPKLDCSNYCVLSPEQLLTKPTQETEGPSLFPSLRLDVSLQADSREPHPVPVTQSASDVIVTGEGRSGDGWNIGFPPVPSYGTVSPFP